MSEVRSVQKTAKVLTYQVCSICKVAWPQNLFLHIEDQQEIINDLLTALEAVMPWASKAVADHPYNNTLGNRALYMARGAIKRAKELE